ncbi:TetR family transcriptional regulator [Longispora fulva]|uniref:AcrR family transcriptional regulator n=1 Tax=Longispora fulva TaxID=619741 RepID=A0A8J7KJ31_9ACTN|nr:TetR/AcrR family transcriptional regulator [Longispora fulva]MBG6135051.1 AcrR family transcriptional regulator [Longispora fulva]GIG56714.1 TetR family transcriptional regulator [Longispora fulva]
MSAQSTASERAAGLAEPPNRRQRARAATLEEIKQTALELMREQGTVDVRFTDIARAMGLTPPALYRYFADRDELLTAMVTDSFEDLAAELAAARESVPATDLGGRFLATCGAYRKWAGANPQRFSLIFGVPVPGYSAPVGGPTTDAAQRAMANLAGLVLDTERHGTLGAPLVPDVSPAFAEFAGCKLAEFGDAIAPATYQAMLLTWSSLHGFVCLEAYGHFFWMEPGIRDDLFRALVRVAAVTTGLTPPD